MIKGLSEMCAELNIDDENVKAFERKINATLLRVKMERFHQAEKHGEPDHTDLEWLAIAMEEVGEVARSAAPWAKYEERLNLENELIQCAAVFCAWAEAEHEKEEP